MGLYVLLYKATCYTIFISHIYCYIIAYCFNTADSITINLVLELKL